MSGLAVAVQDSSQTPKSVPPSIRDASPVSCAPAPKAQAYESDEPIARALRADPAAQSVRTGEAGSGTTNKFPTFVMFKQGDLGSACEDPPDPNDVPAQGLMDSCANIPRVSTNAILPDAANEISSGARAHNDCVTTSSLIGSGVTDEQASEQFTLEQGSTAATPYRPSIVCGMLFMGLAVLVVATLTCTAGAPAATLAFASAASRPDLVAAAVVPAYCSPSSSWGQLPMTHPVQLLVALFVMTCYLVALHEAGLVEFLKACARATAHMAQLAGPACSAFTRVCKRTWRIITACCTGMVIFFMVAYFAQGAEGANLAQATAGAHTGDAAPALTHSNAVRIQHALTWATDHGLMCHEYRYDAIQMIARRTNVTFVNLDIINHENAVSLGASLGIRPSVVPACPAPNSKDGAPEGRLNANITLLDSGSGVHAINSSRFCVPGTEERNTMGISTANGIVVPPTKCTARIPMRTKSGKRTWLVLTGCLILGNSEYTLVSVGRLANEQQVTTTYGPLGSSFAYPDGTVVPLASVDNVLVLPDANAAALPTCSSPVVHGKEGGQNVSWQCLHRRFNDRSYEALRHLPKVAYDPPPAWQKVLSSPPKEHCDECLQAKADSTPSYGHLPRVDRPGLISYDVWTASVGHVHGNQTKVIGFHDQYSTVTKYYLLNSERFEDVQLAIQKYLAWCNSCNVTPYRFHTDNAPQLSGPKMKSWLATKNIHCTTCAAHEPKQNSAIEKCWRAARNDICTAIARHIPPCYWWYIMSAQMQVAWCLPIVDPNTTPCAPVKWTTPWALWSGHRPDVRQHRVIGCLCYYKVFYTNGKFDMRARRALCLGRAEDQPAYVLLDLEKRTIHITPHVRFVEGVLPGLTKYQQPGEPDGDELFKLDPPSAESVTDSIDSDIYPGVNTADSTREMQSSSPPLLLPRPASPPPPLADFDSDSEDNGAPNAPAADVPLALRREGRGRARASTDRLTYGDRHSQTGTAGESSGACSALLTAVALLGVPQTGGFILYLCSNAPRPDSLQAQVAKLGGVPVVNVDVRVGGYNHDMSHPPVANAVIAAASDSRCLAVMASIPCKTWSASRSVAAGGGLAFSRPLRDCNNRLGFTNTDGSLPTAVDTANKIADCAAAALQAAYDHGAGYIFEAPVSRGKDSPFAIPGRESHTGVLEHPSVDALRLGTGGSVINFDQCCTRDDPTQSPQKTTSLLVSPNLAPMVQRIFGPLMCMHPVGTHPSMIGVDEYGELRSTKWEQYSAKMNALLASCLVSINHPWLNITPTSLPSCAPCTESGSPMAAWEAFYSTDAERLCNQPSACVSQWAALKAACASLGSDFSWNFYDTTVDGQCFAAARERDSDSPSFKQAMNGDEAAEWGKACHGEMENLRRHEAAEPTLEDTLPTWNKVKGYASEVANLLWVLKKKYVSGSFDKFKARLVYDGRMQKVNTLNSTGVVMDTFSPTTRHVTHKLLVAQSVEAGGPPVTLSAESYIERIAKKYLPNDPETYPAVSTPCGPRLNDLYEEAVAKRESVDPELQRTFAQKCGAVIYCLPSCRVDCAYTIGMCARCLTYPTPEIDAQLNQCLVYLFQTRTRGLTFSKSGGDLMAWTDSNWTECHSTNGFCIMLGNAVVAYASKRQHSVALSTTEAEIMGASLAAAEIVNIRGILREMGRDMSKPTVLYVDNQGAVALSKDMKSCQRSRHIERRYLRIREWVAMGEIEVRYVATADNAADVLTKPLDPKTFDRHVATLMNFNNKTPATFDIAHSTFDIEAAYLKGEFNEDEVVYARPPLGYRHKIRGVPVVWRLKIPLYGEADAGRIWNRTLVKQLRAQGFKQSEFDPCYFRKLFPNGKRVDILMYVDDGYVVSNAKDLAVKELQELHNKFTLTRKPAQYFLGNDIHVAE